MITKIDKSGIVTCEAYGFSPGTYPIEEFTAEDLLEERRILETYCQAHQISGDVFRKLDDQIAREIDKKCKIEIKCAYCRKKPSEIEEYVEIAKDEGITPDLAVQQEEGTYNPKNGHFCCTDCYIEIGMPATEPGSAKGWVAP